MGVGLPCCSAPLDATGGAVYIVIALAWLRTVDGVTLACPDYVNAGMALLGAGVVALVMDDHGDSSVGLGLRPHDQQAVITMTTPAANRSPRAYALR